MGFAFCRDKWLGVLKRKGPRILHGKWNGIGGKLESGEIPLDCMIREFAEEVGPKLDWEACGLFTIDSIAKIYVFRADYGDNSIPERNDVGEVIDWRCDCNGVAYNLHWLIPLVQANYVEYFSIQERR